MMDGRVTGCVDTELMKCCVADEVMSFSSNCLKHQTFLFYF